jgi:HKD family nuclease
MFAGDNFAGRDICFHHMAKLDFLLQAVTARFHANELRKLLSQKECKRVLGSVAFVLQDGVSAIAPQLKKVSKVATFFVGIRNDITSIQAIKALLALGVRVYAVDTGTRSVIFHPKLFFTEGKTTARLVIGSANMTFSGLHNNIEAGAILDLDLTAKDDKEFVEGMLKTFDALPAQFPDHVFQIKDVAAAEALFDDGRLSDEDVVRAPVVSATIRKGNRDSLKAIKLNRHASPQRKRTVVKSKSKAASVIPISPPAFTKAEGKINHFFEAILGAELRHSQQAWGAKNPKFNRVFLRIWEDEIYTDDKGKYVQIYWKPQSTSSSGWAERREHIDAIRNGAEGIGIVCKDKDAKDGKRRIEYFYNDPLLRLADISEDDDGIYARVIGYISLKDLNQTSSALEDGYLMIWESKGLTERDLNIPSGDGTHATGSMLWKKGAADDIDQRHFFRDEAFAGLDWKHDPNKANYERSEAKFQIVVKGLNYGEFQLKLSHNKDKTSRSYEQKNSMTQVHWGNALKHVAKTDLLGRTMSLYRKEGEPPEFLIEID